APPFPPTAPAETNHPRPEIVDTPDIEGPEVKSHPWEKMLAGRTPDIEPLAKMVPHDFYYVHFRSLTKLLDAADLVGKLGTHFWSQAFHEARSQAVGERLRRQLALKINPHIEPIFERLIEEVAIVGSDPFVAEGSDITVIIRYASDPPIPGHLDVCRHPLIMGLECCLTAAQQARPDACRGHGTYAGVGYQYLVTPDREICVYA